MKDVDRVFSSPSRDLTGFEGPPVTVGTLGSAIRAASGVLELKNLHHELQNARTKERYVVRVDELNLPRGEFVAILGTSGCGKTTLLTILGLARRPFRHDNGMPAAEHFCIREFNKRGSVDHNIMSLYESVAGLRKIEDLRRRLLGFCLQSGELLENLTVQENVEMPMRLNRWATEKTRDRTRELLEILSHAHPGEASHENGREDEKGKLWKRCRHLPSSLSGGEYQRVALARALAHRPEILFLDEPTGSLDPNTARSALATLARMQQEEDVTVVMITHNEELAKEFAGYIVRMHSPKEGHGTIERFEKNEGKGAWINTDSSWRPIPATHAGSDQDKGAAEVPLMT